MRYLKGQTWSTLKAATSIIDHGAETRISVEQQAKALFKRKTKQNRRSSPLEIARKCPISKSTVACLERASQTIIPNQIFESCFQPLGVISLYLFTKKYCVTFFNVTCVMSWSLFICITQQFSATVLTLKP